MCGEKEAKKLSDERGAEKLRGERDEQGEKLRPKWSWPPAKKRVNTNQEERDIEKKKADTDSDRDSGETVIREHP